MKKVLYIDTSSNQIIIVTLKQDGKIVDEIKSPIDQKKAQIILPLIDHLLVKNKLKLKNLSGIEINPGPGSFTGIRVGLSVANTLSYILKIPVNGKKIGTYEKAKYE